MHPLYLRNTFLLSIFAFSTHDACTTDHLLGLVQVDFVNGYQLKYCRGTNAFYNVYSREKKSTPLNRWPPEYVVLSRAILYNSILSSSWLQTLLKNPYQV